MVDSKRNAESRRTSAGKASKGSAGMVRLRVFAAVFIIVAGATIAPVLAVAEVDPSTKNESSASAEAVASPSPGADASPEARARTSGTAGPQSEPSRQPTDADERTSRDPTPEGLTRGTRLRSRAQQRWQQLIAGDYGATYEFMSPDYKESVERQEHAASFGDMITWHMASVQDVRYYDQDQAEVVIALTVSFPLGGEMMKTQIPISERWVYTGGEWYYTATPSDLPLLNHGGTAGD